MSYIDVILESRPSQYYTIGKVNGHKDLSGFGHDAPAVNQWGTYILPGFLTGTLGGNVPNPLGLFSKDSLPEFSIEFWTHPFAVGSAMFVKSSYDYSGISFDQDRFDFTVKSNGISYTAEFLVEDINRPQHVIAVMLRNTIALIVNGEAGVPTALPQEFEFDDVSTALGYFPALMSNFAVYNYALTLADIQKHYEAGTGNAGYREVCVADGADFYDLTSDSVTKALDLVLSEKDFRQGTLNNLNIDRFGNLVNSEYNEFVVYDANGVVASPSLSGALSLPSQWAVLRNMPQVMRSTGGGFVGYINISGACTLFSIYNRNHGRCWTWTSDGSGNVTLTAKTILSDDTSTSTTYTYDTPVGTGEIVIGFVMEPTRVKFGTDTAIIQSSASDWINESIIIDSSTEFILGADDTYTGTAAASYADLFFQPDTSGTASDLSSLLSMNNGCTYPVSSDLRAVTHGTWTYTFAIPYSGAYNGHSMSWFPQGSFGNTVKTSYNGGPFDFCSNYYYFMYGLPKTGTLGGDVVNGPITIKVELSTDSANSAHINHMDIRVFADQNFKAYGTSNLATLRTDDYAVAARYEDPINATVMPTTLFVGSTQSGIDLASADVKSFEMVFAAGSDPGHLMSSPGDTYTMSFVTSPSPNITFSGWDAVYINGQAYTSGSPLPIEDFEYKTHILAVDATGYSGVTTVGAKNDGTDGLYNLGIYSVAVYPDQLTVSEVAEHYGAFTGLIVGQPDVHETLVLEEYGAPFAYSYAWQMTGAPQ